MTSTTIDKLSDFNPAKNPGNIEIIFRNNARLSLQFLDWDTSFFGCPSYRVDFKGFSCKGISSEETEILKSSLKGTFITAVSDNSHEAGLSLFLQASGFRFIESGIILKFRSFPGKKIQCPQNVSVRKVDNLTNLDLKPLGLTFNLTRFHADPNIGKEKADELWVRYLQNFVPSDKKHAFIVFDQKNKPVGGIFINLYSDPDGISTADFFVVSVLKEYSSQGIGTAIAQEAVKWSLNNAEQIIVGTQGRNVNALNFYMKNGFTGIYKTTSIFHRW